MLIKGLGTSISPKMAKSYCAGKTQSWHEAGGKKFETRQEALESVEIGDTVTSHLLDANSPAELRKSGKRALWKSIGAGALAAASIGAAFVGIGAAGIGAVAVGTVATVACVFWSTEADFLLDIANKGQIPVIHRAVEEKIDSMGSPIVQEIDEQRWLLSPISGSENYEVKDLHAWLWERPEMNRMPHTGERGDFWRLGPSSPRAKATLRTSRRKDESGRGIRFEKGGVISNDGDGPFMRSDTSWGFRSGQIEYSIHGMRNTLLNP